MFWHAQKDGKPIFRKDGQPLLKGVVNNWDMASALNEKKQVPLSATQHRTGTLPFMSIDLLERVPPRHYYRHDLESFFYILLWAVLRYDLKNGLRRPLPPSLAKWHSSDIVEAYSFKTYLLMDDTAYHTLSFLLKDPTYREWTEIIKRPLTLLWFMFICGEAKKPRKNAEDLADSDVNPVVLESAAAMIRFASSAVEPEVDVAALPVDFDPSTDELPLLKAKTYDVETCNGLVTFENFIKHAVRY